MTLSNSPQYRQRCKLVLSRLKQSDTPAALVLSAAPAVLRSRDTSYHYRQDSSFFYLTGSHEPGLVLLLRSDLAKALLIEPKRTKESLVWEGPGESLETLASSLSAELIRVPNVAQELQVRLKGIKTLFYQNLPGSLGWNCAKHLIELPSHKRARHNPTRFAHCDLLLEPLRLIKSPLEVKQISCAAQLTSQAILAAIRFAKAGVPESKIAALFEAHVKAAGGTLAFESIVASGKSAAVLHYHHLSRRLKAGEMLMLDVGAELNMYAADITRVFPVSGKFLPWQKKLYLTVLAAQQAAIKKIKHGVKVSAVSDAAIEVLVRGLKDMKVLRGTASSIIKQKKYHEFFPHSIGHSLGLDVHDLGAMRADDRAVLKTGMVITIEPGLYFRKTQASIPACGIRIEDDVLVTASGSKVLTDQLPTGIEEVEELMGEYL